MASGDGSNSSRERQIRGRDDSPQHADPRKRARAARGGDTGGSPTAEQPLSPPAHRTPAAAGSQPRSPPQETRGAQDPQGDPSAACDSTKSVGAEVAPAAAEAVPSGASTPAAADGGAAEPSVGKRQRTEAAGAGGPVPPTPPTNTPDKGKVYFEYDAAAGCVLAHVPARTVQVPSHVVEGCMLASALTPPAAAGALSLPLPDAAVLEWLRLCGVGAAPPSPELAADAVQAVDHMAAHATIDKQPSEDVRAQEQPQAPPHIVPEAQRDAWREVHVRWRDDSAPHREAYAQRDPSAAAAARSAFSALEVLRSLRSDSYPGVPILRQVLRATGLPTVGDVLDRLPYDLHRDACRAWLPAAAEPERMRVAVSDAGLPQGEGGDRALPAIKSAFDGWHARMLTEPQGAVPLAGLTRLELTLYNGALSRKAAQSLASRLANLPALQDVALVACGTAPHPDAWKALAPALGALPTLLSLRLSQCKLGSLQSPPVGRAAAALRHLSHLDLSQNALSGYQLVSTGALAELRQLRDLDLGCNPLACSLLSAVEPGPAVPRGLRRLGLRSCELCSVPRWGEIAWSHRLVRGDEARGLLRKAAAVAVQAEAVAAAADGVVEERLPAFAPPAQLLAPMGAPVPDTEAAAAAMLGPVAFCGMLAQELVDARLSHLTALDLSRNAALTLDFPREFPGMGVGSLEALSQLRTLDVSSTGIELPALTRALMRMQSLQELRASHAPLRSLARLLTEALGRRPALRTLVASYAKLGEAPAALGDYDVAAALPALEVLELEGNELPPAVGGGLYTRLAALPGLRVFKVG